MKRQELPPHANSTYVLPRWKIVYVSVPKAACTSLKWLVADLQDEDRRRFYQAISFEVGRSTTIHRRSLWQHTPTLHELTDRELDSVSPDDGWFVFSVVRHPATRLWSGWQSKFLLQEPRWVTRFGSSDWFPSVPTSTQEVVDSFRCFAVSLLADPLQPVLQDRHFRSQASLLTQERTPYTRVYGTHEIPALLTDLETHLRIHGWEADGLELEPSNETPLRPVRAAFDEDVLQAITTVYRDDFKTFGYPALPPDGLASVEEYPEATLQEIRRLVERAERIGDLVRAAKRLTRRLEAAPGRAHSPQTLPRRVRRRLGH